MGTQRRMEAVGASIVLLGLTVIANRVLPYNYWLAQVFRYLEPLLLLCSLWLLIQFAIQASISSPRGKLVGNILYALVLLGLDPYSYGRKGGHWGLQAEYVWQVVIAISLVLVLLSAVFALQTRRSSVGRLILIGEFVAFGLINGYYLMRDGSLRLFAGDPSSPMPLLALLVGLTIRAHILSAWRVGAVESELK